MLLSRWEFWVAVIIVGGLLYTISKQLGVIERQLGQIIGHLKTGGRYDDLP